MRAAIGVFFGALLLALFSVCAAQAGTCAASEPFVKADQLFTQAASAKDSAAAKRLWDDGTALLSAHRDDPAPASCDPDDYVLTRLAAFEHGIRVGYKWAGMTLEQAVKASGDLETAAVELARGKRTAYQVRESWLSRAVFKQILQYETQLKVTLHTPGGSNCEAPNVEADVLDAVMPEPSPAIRAGQPVTVGVLATIDPTGKVTDLRITPKTSTMNSFIDHAAIQAARFSTYLPKIQNCVPVEGTYMFLATFDPE